MQLDPSLLTSAQIQQPCIQVNYQNTFLTNKIFANKYSNVLYRICLK